MLTNADSAAFQVEPATQGHLDMLVQLEEQCFTAPWTRQMFEAELNGNPFSTLLVYRDPARTAEHPDTIDGYICFWIVFDELRLMNVAVSPALRRRGIGKRLLTAALATGVEQGVRRIVLEVRASNEAARLLYEGAGFRVSGVRPKYYSNPVEDAILMERESCTRIG